MAGDEAEVLASRTFLPLRGRCLRAAGEQTEGVSRSGLTKSGTAPFSGLRRARPCLCRSGLNCAIGHGFACFHNPEGSRIVVGTREIPSGPALRSGPPPPKGEETESPNAERSRARNTVPRWGRGPACGRRRRDVAGKHRQHGPRWGRGPACGKRRRDVARKQAQPKSARVENVARPIRTGEVASCSLGRTSSRAPSLRPQPSG